MSIFHKSNKSRLLNPERPKDALKREYAELYQIFNVAVPLCVLSKDDQVLRVNDPFCSLFRIKREEIVGKKCHAFWSRPLGGMLEGHLGQILNGAERCEQEMDIELGNGKAISCRITATPYRDTQGEILGIIASFIEITEHKRVERALRESEERFRKYFELGLVGIAVVSPEKRFIEVNDSLCEMLGYSREEIMHMSWADLTPGEDLGSEEKEYDRVLAGEIDGYPFEKRYIRKDGRIILANLSARCVRRQDGSIAHFVCLLQDITKRRQAEEDLQKAEKDKATILNSLSEHVIYQDVHMKLLWVNQSAATSVGLTPEEMIGHHCYEIWQKSDKPCVGCPVVKARETGQPQSGEMNTLDGRVWLVSGYPVRDPEGHITGLVEITMDITKRKRAEEELGTYRSHLEDLIRKRTAQLTEANEHLKQEIIERKRVEEYLRRQAQIIDQIRDSVISTDLNGYVTSWNKGAEKLFGYGEKEAIGKHISFMYAPEEQEFLEKKVIAPLKEKGAYETEIRAKKKTGEEFYIHLSLSLLKDSANTIHGMISYSIDITKRKEAEMALRESEEKYSTLVEQAQEGVAIIQDGVCKFANLGVTMINGYPAEELLEKPLAMLIKDEYKSLVEKHYRAQLAGERVPSLLEYKIECKDGTVKDVETTTTLIQFHKRPAVLALTRDITQRKKIEQELQKIQKLESLGILAGGIAHDFNNLLGAIIGNLSLMELYAKPDDNFTEVLKETRNIAQQTKHLTQQMLTFARGGEPVRKRISVLKVLEDTVTLALSGSKSKYELHIPENLWLTEIDEVQIAQALSNVLINADQAMPEGGNIQVSADNIMVKAEHGLSLKEGKYVKISVKDQGMGIPEEHIPKVFDPFFTTKPKGSGLGLTITYSIIKRHHGYVTIQSRPGAGTTMYMYLPAWEGKIPAGEVAPGGMHKEKVYPAKGKILFMDDQLSLRTMLEKMLIHLGYMVECVADGAAAVEAFTRANESGRPFDAVILDLTVPGGMGGQEALEKIHEIDPKAKVIVSSGYADDPVLADYRRYGFSGAVAKPYEISELSRILFTIINR